MRGSQIIVSANPQGKFDEGIITGTPKPGTLMQMDVSEALSGGRFSYEAVNNADGAKGPICVLLEDELQGFTAETSYVSGKRGRLYWPLPGEELNLLLGDVAGTGDIVTRGDVFGVADGKLKANAGFATAPFQALESKAALTADALLWVRYLGPFA